MTIFEELLSRIDNQVRYFRGDLDHDKREIESAPGKPFMHYATECGTHLKMLDYPHVDQVWMWNKIKHYPDGGVFHYFDGQTLTQLNLEENIDD
jgi:hypothetical protein